MLRTLSKAVSEGNSPVIRAKSGRGEHITAELFRMLKNHFDKMASHFDELIEDRSRTAVNTWIQSHISLNSHHVSP